MAVADFLLPSDVAALTNPGARSVVEVPEPTADIAVGTSQFSQELAAAVVSVVLTTQPNLLPAEPVTLPWTTPTLVAPPAVEVPATLDPAAPNNAPDELRPTAPQPETSIFAQILAEARRIATSHSAPPHQSTPAEAELPTRFERLEPSTRLLEALGRPSLTDAAAPEEPVEASDQEQADPLQRVPMLLAEISRMLSYATPQPTPTATPQNDSDIPADTRPADPQVSTRQVAGIAPELQPEWEREPSDQQPPASAFAADDQARLEVPPDTAQEPTPSVTRALSSSRRVSPAERSASRDDVRPTAAEHEPTAAVTTASTANPHLAATAPVVPSAPVTPTSSTEPTLRAPLERVASSRGLPATAAGEPQADAYSERSPQTGVADLLTTSGRSPLGDGSAAGVGEPTVSARDPEVFAERLSRFVVQASERHEELQVRITPPDLGTIVIQVRSQGDGLSIRLEASSEASQQLLHDNLPLLQESLAQLGRTAERIDVVRTEGSLQFGSGGMAWSQQGSQDFRQSPEPRPVRLPERLAEPVTSPMSAVTMPGLDRLQELNIQI